MTRSLECLAPLRATRSRGAVGPILAVHACYAVGSATKRLVWLLPLRVEWLLPAKRLEWLLPLKVEWLLPAKRLVWLPAS